MKHQPQPDQFAPIHPRRVLSLWRGLMPIQRALMAPIATRIAESHGLTLDDLKGPERCRRVAWPRQEAYAAIYETGCYSFAQIGRFFGGRDHSTVQKGLKRHAARMCGESAE